MRTALLEAPGVDDVGLLVVVDEPSSPQQADVLATVSQSVRGDYVRAARLLGRLDVDVVLIEHEYGIYGGRDGEYVLSFARELSQPLVVTLHTLLSKPAPHQLDVLVALCLEAERVIVMTETARRLLVELRACPAEKIRIVPHGAPALLGKRRAEHAAGRRPVYVTPGNGGYEGMQSRFLLSTFGLLSAGKGLEAALEAMPEIVERHPEVLYMIAGRTHPQVARREGEKYRLELERQVVDLGLEGHVAFDDRFLTIDELADLLAATDVFVTPYRNREQIASGALTFALAAGCAAVSTPYWYAEDVLASGAGTTVPFGDPQALAGAVCDYIEQPDLLAAARLEAQRIGSELRWSSVAEATAGVLREAAVAAPMRTPIPSVDLRLSQARTDHLHTLVDDVGIVQHAHGVIPNWSSGYCVDDVARLAIVALELERRDIDERWTTILYRALAFLQSASEGNGHGMRNFMSYERRWLDNRHIGDHVGRSIWALGEVLSTAWVPGVVAPASRMLTSLVSSMNGDVSLRTAAYSILGIARLDPDRLESDAGVLLEGSSTSSRPSTGAWRPIPGAGSRTISATTTPASHRHSSSEEKRSAESAPWRRGSSRSNWLGDECGLADGMLLLTGHRGRHRNEPAPGTGDEQPLDASALVEAELAAFASTHDPEHGSRAQTAFDWFLGRNRLNRPLYDFATGGCSDGLGDETINGNEGAESTLAFHRAQLSLDTAELPVVLRPGATRELAAA